MTTMQLHKTMRTAGVSLSAVALALLTAEGPAAAHERTSVPDLRGRVTSVASRDFVLQKCDGTTETVDTTDATTYSEPGSSIAAPGSRTARTWRSRLTRRTEPDGDERGRVPREGRRSRHQCRRIDRHADQHARRRHGPGVTEHEVLREGRQPDRCERWWSGDRLRPAARRHTRRTGREVVPSSARRRSRSRSSPGPAASVAFGGQRPRPPVTPDVGEGPGSVPLAGRARGLVAPGPTQPGTPDTSGR